MGTQPTFTCPKLTMKHQNNMQNLFKVNNEDTRMTSLTSVWCCYFWLWTDFTHCSGVSIVDFEQVHADWVSNFPFKIKTETVYHGYILQKIHYHLIGFFLISLQIHRSCSMSRMLFWEIFENFWISYFQEPLCMAAFIMSKKFNYVIYKLLLGNTWSLNCYSSVKND